MPKVNIYLPSELAEEAREAELSLSPICQRALREELNKMHARKAATRDLKAVAARLRATLGEEESEERASGYTDGVAWAREYATASELRYVARGFELGSGGAFGPDHSLCAFCSARDGEQYVSVGHEHNAYWIGFIAGATEVLEAVERLL